MALYNSYHIDDNFELDFRLILRPLETLPFNFEILEACQILYYIWMPVCLQNNSIYFKSKMEEQKSSLVSRRYARY